MYRDHQQVIRTYLSLAFISTFGASLIWGINTLFLLDAGLSNTQAFLANAFFTAGQVIFEVPTGIVADSWGRRTSYLLGSATLGVSTFLYFLLWQSHASIALWAIVSVLLGLGFTFFSGAVEAWLVDALAYTKHTGDLDSVFARGQVLTGMGMLLGSVTGGVLAQVTNLGVPFVLRAVLMLLTFVIAWRMMHDVGFTPERVKNPLRQVSLIFKASIEHGIKNPPVKWLMIAAPFGAGVSFYGFYALQPYLLQLYGKPDAYWIAGITAAVVAGAQVAGGMLAPKIRGLFRMRTSILLLAVAASGLSLLGMGLLQNFWIVVVLVVTWAVAFAAAMPIRQAYINGLIPSKQRATVLSFDSLMASTGGVVAQPALGKSADVYGYATSYVFSGAIQLLAVPFVWLAKSQHAKSDPIKKSGDANTS